MLDKLGPFGKGAVHSLEQIVEIRVLAKQGVTIKQIARDLGMSRNTVRKYLRDDNRTPTYGPRLPRSTKLDPFKDYLRQRVKAAHPDWLPATALFREIQARGYHGGLTQLRSFLADLKPSVIDEPVVRFETAPGEQMQVDFVEIRKGADRLAGFVATLGYSRYAFVRFVTDEKIDTVIDCMHWAFDYFGGVPAHVLFDNMKTVVIERDAYGGGQHRFHPQMLMLAQDVGFKIRLCRPYRAKTKGKVERFIRYLRGSFWLPLKTDFKMVGMTVDADSANEAVGRWLHDVANARRHAELGERPVDRFEEERSSLLPYESPDRPMPLPRRSVPVPIELLQHDLSIYDELVLS